MSMTHEPALSTPTSHKGGQTSSAPQQNAAGRQQFFVMALNMSWQLAIAVLVPILLGVWLDKATDQSYGVFVGLGLAFVASGVVMWRTMQLANSLPVPKLTAEQKRAVQKQYEEDDKDA